MVAPVILVETTPRRAADGTPADGTPVAVSSPMTLESIKVGAEAHITTAARVGLVIGWADALTLAIEDAALAAIRSQRQPIPVPNTYPKDHA